VQKSKTEDGTVLQSLSHCAQSIFTEDRFVKEAIEKDFCPECLPTIFYEALNS